MSSAVKVLTGHRRLRLVLQRVGRVPGVRYTNEKTTWVDLIHRRMVVEGGGRVSVRKAHRQRSVSYSSPEHISITVLPRPQHPRRKRVRPRHLRLQLDRLYFICAYLSVCLSVYQLDPGGLAEQGGIKMGDQILSANGASFEDITHSRAVEVLKSQRHLTLTIKEAGRYPAYQELVAEYSWLDKRCSKAFHSLPRGSDSSSSASSLSSGTPLSSVTGLSQATLPLSLPLRSQMTDMSSFTEGQFHTDSLKNDFHTETSLSHGPTELLQDSAIRNDEGAGGGGDDRREGRKTSLLMALSRPGPPIRRTQSHMTVSEEEQRKQKKQKEGREDGGISLQRSKTFLGLLRKRSSSRERSKSPPRDEPAQGKMLKGSSDQEVLTQVEEMAKKLLEEEDVAVLTEICKRYTVERELKSLVRPLLSILDGPEKLLLLREIRMLVPKEDLQQFNNLVKPFEEEAYDILKRRSRRSSPLRSPKAGQPPSATSSHLYQVRQDQPARWVRAPGSRGRGQTEPAPGAVTASSPSQTQSETEEPTRVSFTPLLDVPVDSYSHSDSLKPPRSSPTIPNWLLTQDSHSPPTTPSELAPHLENAPSRRGRSPFRNGLSESKAYKKEKAGRNVFFTIVDTPRHRRPPLSQVFTPLRSYRALQRPLWD
ncbi:hypothetical protein QTP86_015090, partial [Hemibagrus guttatus]